MGIFGLDAEECPGESGPSVEEDRSSVVCVSGIDGFKGVSDTLESISFVGVWDDVTCRSMTEDEPVIDDDDPSINSPDIILWK